MKVGMFAILDRKTGAYMQPFFQLTRGQAMRSLGDTMVDPGSVVGKHPEDFALYQLAEFDDTEGSVEALPEVARFVCNCSEFDAKANGFQVGIPFGGSDAHDLRPVDSPAVAGNRPNGRK